MYMQDLRSRYGKDSDVSMKILNEQILLELNKFE